MTNTIINVSRFVFERLPNPKLRAGAKPCLAEDWFVEDMHPITPEWLTEADLRRMWRVARLQRLGLYNGAGSPNLLFHQMAALMPILFLAAQGISHEQRKAHD